MYSLTTIFLIVAFGLLAVHVYQLRYLVVKFIESRTKNGVDIRHTILSLVKFSEYFHNSSPKLHKFVVNQEDPVLKGSMELLMDQDKTEMHRQAAFTNLKKKQVEHLKQEVQMIRTVGKFLPLVSLAFCIFALSWTYDYLNKPEFIDQFLQSSYFFMASIFYGVLLSMLAIGPLTIRYFSWIHLEEKRNRVVEEAVAAIPNHPNPVYFLERLNALVKEEETVDWRDLLKLNVLEDVA